VRGQRHRDHTHGGQGEEEEGRAAVNGDGRKTPETFTSGSVRPKLRDSNSRNRESANRREVSSVAN
jgi:hypothetical protein